MENENTLLFTLLPALILIEACLGTSGVGKRLNEGSELREEGRLNEAIEKYDEALQMDPEFLTRDYARGLAFDLYYHRGARLQ